MSQKTEIKTDRANPAVILSDKDAVQTIRFYNSKKRLMGFKVKECWEKIRIGYSTPDRIGSIRLNGEFIASIKTEELLELSGAENMILFAGGLNEILGITEKTIPEIQILRLIDFNFKWGNTRSQRAQYTYNLNGKAKMKRGKFKEKLPLSLEKFVFKKGYNYTFKFECSICGKKVYKYFNGNYPNTVKTTPTCNHDQLLGSKTTPIYGLKPHKIPVQPYYTMIFNRITRKWNRHKITYRIEKFEKIADVGNTYYIQLKNWRRDITQKMFIHSVKAKRIKRCKK